MSEVRNPSAADDTPQRPVYYPGRDATWTRKTPEDVGIDPYLLREAITFAEDPSHAGYPGLSRPNSHPAGGRW